MMVDRGLNERFVLTLAVEGGSVPLTFFVQTTADLQRLLRAIEEVRLGESPHAQWEVDTDRIQIAASVNGVSADDLESIVTDAYQSLRATEASDLDSIPSTVDERGRRLSRSIVRRVKRTAPIVLDTPGQEPVRIEPEPLFAPNSPRRRNIIESAWDSVDGELDVISVRRNPHFVIYQHASTNQIRCTFPDEWMETVKDLLGSRVIAEGLVRYRNDGSITSLSEPTAITPVEEPKRTIAEFRGTLPRISGELSSADYIRQLRG